MTTVDVEKAPSPPSQTQDSSEHDSFPEGGFHSWLVLAGSFMGCFCSFGYINSFGIFLPYYESHQLSDKTKSQIAWIGSLQAFFMFLWGPVSGSLFDKYGARKIMIPASTILVFSIMMTSLCESYYQLILAQGLLSGSAISFVFTPCVSVVGHYFKRLRATALGIVIGGSSIGAVVIPILLSTLFNHSSLSFGWTVRIAGFLILASLIFSCAVVEERLPSRHGTMLLPSAFKDVAYTFCVMGNFFDSLGLYTPFFYIVTYATSNGMSVGLAYYLIAIMNGASFPGRVIPGILADRLGRFNMFIAASVCASIIEFSWIAADNNVGIIVFTAVYGAFSGSVISLMNAALAEVTPEANKLGTYIGMNMGVVGVANLIGTPIAGAMISKYGRYTEAVVFSGVAVMCGAISLSVAKIVHEKHLKKA